MERKMGTHSAFASSTVATKNAAQNPVSNRGDAKSSGELPPAPLPSPQDAAGPLELRQPPSPSPTAPSPGAPAWRPRGPRRRWPDPRGARRLLPSGRLHSSVRRSPHAAARLALRHPPPPSPPPSPPPTSPVPTPTPPRRAPSSPASSTPPGAHSPAPAPGRSSPTAPRSPARTPSPSTTLGTLMGVSAFGGAQAQQRRAARAPAEGDEGARGAQRVPREEEEERRRGAVWRRRRRRRQRRGRSLGGSWWRDHGDMGRQIAGADFLCDGAGASGREAAAAAAATALFEDGRVRPPRLGLEK
ncbi:serine/arginine repetitive matrix protein 1-like [Panicum virgatum]|uniref:serine/arginine repetitive matrix protein 1-like n=1 Tax=Panicum virgatum TaxID=38727 RepID=UPI0019D58879|nr:serine/arginine repetitive matrix protein 1-like [Panicum virgatum]